MQFHEVLTSAGMPTLILVLIGIGGLFVISRATERFKNKGMFLWQCSYQLATLAMALILLFINRSIHGDYRSALNYGYFEAPTHYFSWMGIKDGTPWSSAVTTFLIFPFIATTVVVYLQILRAKQVCFVTIAKVLPAAIILSIFNSFTEEIIFRVIGIEGLSSTLSITVLALISGIWFGIPHYFGTPGKLPGVVMAGFLGWVAAISILETGGFAAAWGIHFVQDVPIITMLLAVAVKEARD